MTLTDLKEGIIVIKIHTSHDDFFVAHSKFEKESARQYHEDDSESEDRRRRLRAYDNSWIPDTFVLEYAIDGKITALDRDQFLDQKKQIQRVMETLTLLDDPSFTSNAQDVEVAVRLKGCEGTCMFGVSHIYWA